MKEKWKKYRFLLLALAAGLLSLPIFPEQGSSAFRFAGQNLLNFVFLLLPVFLCVGLLEVWVSKERMIRLMGEHSGVRGRLLACLAGVVTAVPFYALLPISALLLKKSCRLSNVFLFLFSSTAIRIPLLLFEASSFGWAFTAVRFAVNLAGVFLLSRLLDRLLSPKDRQAVYARAEKL